MEAPEVYDELVKSESLTMAKDAQGFATKGQTVYPLERTAEGMKVQARKGAKDLVPTVEFIWACGLDYFVEGRERLLTDPITGTPPACSA